MKRGDVVLAAAGGDYGKPRPWVVVQTDMVAETHPSITLCPITTFNREDAEHRLLVEPDGDNGLRERSLVMVDKIQSLRRERIKNRVGALSGETLRSLDSALRVWLGLA